VDLTERVSRDTVRRVVEAQELERTRLARELHDETGQALTSMLLGLKPLEDRIDTDEGRAAAAELRALVVTTLRDVRRLAVELRPAALDDFGLVPALERLRDTVAEQSGVDVDVQSHLDVVRLPPELETALYRIAQEALTNVVKHAAANRVSVVVSQRERTVVLVVSDDGRGFGGTVREDGLGLIGMRERVALLGGHLTVDSTEGAGTMLTAELPLP
jgi:signal transduction histidine kinase